MRVQSRNVTLPVGVAMIAISAIALHTPASAAPLPRVGASKDYQVEYLLSDGSIPSEQIDLGFRNGWGIAASATGPWWVAVNEMESASVVDASGMTQALHVTIPGAPTGIVHSDSSGFVITDGTTSGSARFLFALEDGKIVGWNPSVGPAAPEQEAFLGADRSTAGAVYKGLAIAQTLTGTRLYATDFHNARVDVFDESFTLVTTQGGFVDPKIPAGYAPFGIQMIAGSIFVSYAKQDADAIDEVAGQGLGMVDVFDPDGMLIAQVGSHGQLNAPWGIALAPAAGFGAASGTLLVGNFGDGTIQTFAFTDDFRKFTPTGQLRSADRKPIRIDGLWGIAFGNGGQAGDPNALYFAAGPADETHGSFGRVTLQVTP
jgi:uncharacterized protein (TIGR03118 family)